MSFNFSLFVVIGSLIFSIYGCNEPKEKKKNTPIAKKELIKNNRQSVRMEADQIAQYVKRRNWPTIQTETGLHYWIYESPNSNLPVAKKEDVAVVSYKISLINGQTIYESTNDKPAEFVVGKDEVEQGLQEGILFMRPGDRAKLIIPSHLAHGFTGDFNKIPKNATLIFDIKLIALK